MGMGEQQMKPEMRMVGVDCPWCEKRFVTGIYQLREEIQCMHCEEKILLICRLEKMDFLKLLPLKEKRESVRRTTPAREAV